MVEGSRPSPLGVIDWLTMGVGNDGQQVRIILVPRFDKTGEIVVVDLESLEPELVRFSVEQ